MATAGGSMYVDGMPAVSVEAGFCDRKKSTPPLTRNRRGRNLLVLRVTSPDKSTWLRTADVPLQHQDAHSHRTSSDFPVWRIPQPCRVEAATHVNWMPDCRTWLRPAKQTFPTLFFYGG